ncbi:MULTISPECIES: VOC family protein [Niastella]|uniref:VOC family protein n=1 Tax=Niastella soli TaxID=2821487 RepID=A0ABS3YX29_9BACT|nr:VOC family protein [Niastella soli]MBO9202448.1 VOC family protein [Niastella soli]
MQKIIPHLWFNTEAKEAAQFYTSVFPGSKITHTSVLKNTPSGDCDIVGFTLWDHEFMAISAGPYFTFNPSVSFIVNVDPLFFGKAPDREKAAREKLDAMWDQLMDGGTALMPLNEYPFSKRFGWVKDKYGVSWQLMLTNPEGEQRPAIIPTLVFVNDNCGKAEEAINFYLSVFKNSKPGNLRLRPKGMEPDKEGTVLFGDFMLENSWFAAMDSAHDHKFNFNEAISFLVNCTDQTELDAYWDKLSAVPQSEQCGWCKDKYGLSWQISSAEMQEMMSKGSQAQIDRLVKTFMPMKKLDIAKLEAAYAEK